MLNRTILIWVCLVFAGCGNIEGEALDTVLLGAGDRAGGIETTLSSIQRNIFSPRCARTQCHGALSPPLGLSLKNGNTYDNLVGISSAQPSANMLRVDPFNPDESYLILKLEGTGKGARMPLEGVSLTNAEIEVIKLWIAEGAENN